MDDFDNKVYYWVMTASSFCDASASKKAELSNKEYDESIPFIFQEVNFYVNKSIIKLEEIRPDVTVIFNREIRYSKLIDAYRLETVIHILKQVREKSYKLESELEANENLSKNGVEMVNKQKESDEIYDKKMKAILNSDQVQRTLGKKIDW